MSRVRFLCSVAAVGLAASIVQPSWAQPHGAPGRPHPGHKKKKGERPGPGPKKSGPRGLRGPNAMKQGGRYHELKKKQAAGTLTEEEKKQLEQMEQRIEARKEKRAERREQRQEQLAA